ncbi:MAG: DUF3788 domain-containing protein [Bacillota bacterium]|nr:DUF3788 domain-containing protein [Bacillota bacterium]
MEWKEAFPSDRQPTMKEIEDYIGGEAKELWQLLMQYMDTAYKSKPKMSYSACSGKPGWNIKFQKSGQSFGTLYPEENAFSVFIVISYKLDRVMEDILPFLSTDMAEMYRKAGEYMKLGKWMMFQIKDQTGVDDYKKLMSVKMSSRNA